MMCRKSVLQVYGTGTIGLSSRLKVTRTDAIGLLHQPKATRTVVAVE